MNTYQKKPIQISAIKLTCENAYDVMTWANHIQPAEKKITLSIDGGVMLGLIIPTKEGIMLCGIGDYLIKEPFPTDDRMFYPCKSDMFELTYEYVVPAL
jgi:hypothetical protein